MRLSASDSVLNAAAEAVYQAQTGRQRLGSFSQLCPGLTADDAYEIQSRIIRLHQLHGHEKTGYKIAYTSSATRSRFGIGEPCFGQITSDRVLPSGSPFSISAQTVLKAEPEVIFLLGSDLSGPNVTADQALRAVKAWMPGFELVLPCFSPKEHELAGEIAENMSFGAMVCGSPQPPLPMEGWSGIKVDFYCGEQLLSQATEAEILDGSPISSLVWLANRLSRSGMHLKKGDYVLSGSPVAPVFLDKGDSIRAVFEANGLRHSVSTQII